MASFPSTFYPWAASPLVANAPMGGFAGSRLAVAVTAAGGLGFIGAVQDMDALASKLEDATRELAAMQTSTRKSGPPPETLPIGVGFLVFAAALDRAAEVVAQHRPSTIWLSCAKAAADDYSIWTQALRAASPESRIWIQIADVAAALSVCRLCRPDVLVLQAADAGGHGQMPGAGLVSLIPEARDALNAAGFEHVPILAAGGISDGRGVAAALACGAAGVVMGTRFLACHEVDLPHRQYLDAILAAENGGVSTVRATVFDELKGTSIWPDGYDGRALVSPSYRDFIDGVRLEQIQARYRESLNEANGGYGEEGRAGRVAIWAGTGVGLVKELKGGGEIVQEVREDAKSALKRATEKLQ